jgi:DNA-binding response OmpR family regulator
VRILIVDDDPDLGEVIQTLLEQNGYETILARNGEEAKNALS